MLYQVYAGSYTSEGDRDGIYQIELDTDKEKLRLLRTYREMESPSFLAVRGEYLYAVSERDDDGAVGRSEERRVGKEC